MISYLLNRGCTTQNSRGGQKNVFIFKGKNLRNMMFYERNKLNKQNFELCGPNKKLSRAMFCPRAVRLNAVV